MEATCQGLTGLLLPSGEKVGMRGLGLFDFPITVDPPHPDPLPHGERKK